MVIKIPSFKGENVLITGGLGFIGSNLTHMLVNQGASVTLFSLSNKNLRNIKEIENKVKVIYGDIRDKEKVKQLVKGKEHIFHFAAQINHFVSMQEPNLDTDINCNGALNILESCRRFNDKTNIIFSSTQPGKVNKIPANEQDNYEPLTVYEVNKLACEKYLQLYYKIYGLKTTTIRFSNVFGERQQVTDASRGVLNHMIRRSMLSEPITIFGEGDLIRDYCYIQNYLEACMIVAKSNKTKGNFYVTGSGKGLTFKEMVKKVNAKVKELTGKSTEIVQIPFPEDQKKLDRGNFIADFSRLNSDTGWSPTISFDEGLKRTILFYQKRLEEYINQ